VYSNSGNSIDLWDVCGKYAVDAIATSAFAVRIDAYDSAGNPFVANAVNKFRFGVVDEMASFALPVSVRRWLRLSAAPNDSFFVDSIRRILSLRRQNPNEKHNDFIQLLMDTEAINTGEDIDEDRGLNTNTHHDNEGKY